MSPERLVIIRELKRKISTIAPAAASSQAPDSNKIENIDKVWL